MSPRTIARDARVLHREFLATLREVVLLPRDLGPILPELGRPRAGRGAAPDGDVIVLLHGFLASGGVFRPMRAQLEAEGLCVASFSYAPGRSIRSVAERLAELVERLPRALRVHIVGHSFGGIVARDYVQNLGGHDRVAQTVSLASPFGGAPGAKRFAWLARDLHPKSKTLAAIRACPPHVRVPHLSIIAGDDRMVPPESARFPGAPYVTLPDRGHNTLLFDPEVVRIVVATVGRLASQAA